MAGVNEIHVEVAYAAPDRQIVKSLTLPLGSRVDAAIRASGLLQEFPEIDLAVNRVGVFGELVGLETLVQDGERVEIYRPLLADPKQARRRRAAIRAGKTRRLR
jgi:putative ubiquitin-RnfH superfamily antitoxin RatB of RatAB toxin-antitoxin module